MCFENNFAIGSKEKLVQVHLATMDDEACAASALMLMMHKIAGDEGLASNCAACKVDCKV